MTSVVNSFFIQDPTIWSLSVAPFRIAIADAPTLRYLRYLLFKNVFLPAPLAHLAKPLGVPTLLFLPFSFCLEYSPPPMHSVRSLNSRSPPPFFPIPTLSKSPVSSATPCPELFYRRMINLCELCDLCGEHYFRINSHYLVTLGGSIPHCHRRRSHPSLPSVQNGSKDYPLRVIKIIDSLRIKVTDGISST